MSTQKNLSSLHNTSYRLHFRILSCTSSDNNFSASQLQLQSPQSKGWQSQRFCTYPQTIIVQLVDLAIVQKLTFLSHQSKIPTQIDIQCKQEQVEKWKKLGYTCLESNMTTNYESRQLKTVKLGKKVIKLMKFTFHHNFVNTINVFNQVGLIALSVYGQSYHPRPLQQMRERGVLPPGAILDKETLDKLRQLQYSKRQAIDKNDFQKASQIKQQLQRVKSGVQALAILQKQKKDAIRRQDYEQAKKIYEKMKRIRGPFPRAVFSSNNRYEQLNKSSQYQRNKQTFTPVVHSITKKHKSISYDVSGNQVVPQSPILGLKLNKNQIPKAIASKSLHNNNRPLINIDDIVVGPKSNRNIFQDQQYPISEQENHVGNTVKAVKKQGNRKHQPTQQQKPKFMRNKIPQTKDKIQEQPRNNELSLPTESEQYMDVIPELTLRNVFSNDKNLRQHGIDQVLGLVDKIQQQDFLQKLFINAVIFVVKNSMDDKIISILLKSIQLLGKTFKQYKPKPQQISRQNLKNLKHILQKLSQYLGHPNQNLKSQAEDVYVILPKFSKATSKQITLQTITLNQNIDRIPRTIIAKLQMLGTLIRKYDLQNLNGKDHTNRKKQKYEDVIEYAKRFLEDRHGDVRATSMKLIVFIGKIIGTQEMVKALNDVRKATLTTIKQRLTNVNQTQPNSSILLKDQAKLSPKRSISPRVLSPRKSPQLTKKQQSPRVNSKAIKPLQPMKKPQIQALIAPKQAKGQPTKIKNQPKPLSPQNKQPYVPRNPQYSCQYCRYYDKRLQNQTFRDIHWFRQCKMITICKQCNQCVQIQHYNQHLFQQCDKKKFWKKCPRCKQPTLNKDFNQHVQKKACIPAKSQNVANRCPLCHQDIDPKQKGWIKHLIQEGCPCQNDRAQ